MLYYNEQTGQWDYKVPVDASCLNTLSGCPTEQFRKEIQDVLFSTPAERAREMDGPNYAVDYPHLRASKDPLHDIALVSYNGQPEEKRMYMPGYEGYFNMLPVLNPGESDVTEKMAETHEVVQLLANTLAKEPWVTDHKVPLGGFHRHILALEKPETGSFMGTYEAYDTNGDIVFEDSDYLKKAGKEIIVAHWGDGFISPVHGHMAGLEIEEMIAGELIVNRYQQIHPDSIMVRLASSQMYTGRQTIEFAYTEAGQNDKFQRQQLIHNFISVGTSHSLHYVPEHSLDGMGNSFNVQYFEDIHDIHDHDLTRLTLEQALKLKPGSVMLVRSANVPYFGDHFVAIVGGMVMKPHGLRQKDVAIIAKNQHSALLDGHSDFDSPAPAGTILLQLSDDLAKAFFSFHDIKIESEAVLNFDEHYDLRYDQVKSLTTQEAMYARRSDVLLIRSKSLPSFGDHYVVITGHAVQKDHGVRPQMAMFPAMQNSPLLDMFDGPNQNAVILKLNNEATQEFLNFYSIHLDEGLNVVSDNVKLELV